MAWVRVDDSFYDAEKWIGAPAESVGLWVAAMAWCNRNDDRDGARQGVIPEFTVRNLLAVRNIKATLAELCQRGAFHPVDGGYRIHDYEEYQQNEKVQAIRDKRRAAGRKGAAARWGHSNDMANAMASVNGSACPGPVPVTPMQLPQMFSVPREDQTG